KARATVGLVEGVLDRLEVPTTDGGGIAYEVDQATALNRTEIVVEAIPEQAELKRKVFAEIEGQISSDAIIASNTSAIPVTPVAEGLRPPGRVFGWPWSNPPPLIPMNEVIPGEQTAPEVTSAIEALTRRIGYHPVTLKKEAPGFVENRILYAIMRECLALV